MKDLGIYIHIPFCKSKCYYCDFISFPNSYGESKYYINYLLREMDLYKEKLASYRIRTIFIGGGTPSHIEGKYIYKVLDHIYKNFNVKDLEEVTIEANPGTLDEEKLKIYKEAGINRVSLGVQSLDDQLLKGIGRSHTSRDVYDSIEKIRKAGFSNINVDLIFGLADQGLKECERALREMARLDIEHISHYSLIVEDNTLMDKWHREGKIQLPDEDLEREMYYLSKEILKDRGYKHYEISNFAKPGFESQHNLFYWQLKPYIGFGLASHSNLAGWRFWNLDRFKDYYHSIDLGKLPMADQEKIDREMEMAEYLILGMRLIEGISRKEFQKRFNLSVEEVYGDILEKHRKDGLVDLGEEYIKFTPKGLDLSNRVYVDLLP